MFRWFRALAGATLLTLALSQPALAADELTAAELLDATDDVTRGDSAHAVMTMDVKTSRYERTMKMESWSRGTEDTLIRILAPAKDAGTATLKSGDNIWNYLPKVDRTMKVPAGMMGGSWMGSHFSNDDLVKDSRMSADYTFSFTARPDTDPEGNYVIECIPKPEAPVVWGKVIVHVRPDKIPTRIEYYDEKAVLMRTMLFTDISDFGGRQVPRHMSLEPADKPGEYTRMTYEELQFDVDIPASTFTLQALKQ